MSYSLERMVWMPSPPLAPDCGPDQVIDFAHLGRMTLGDPGLEREVLAMFAAQAADLTARLTKLPPDAAALTHTLKGSARAIGASRVADAAAGLEHALSSGEVTAASVSGLCDAVAEARAVIDGILRRS
jgi:HPt (histidine-containing phosphotransfer) domain-containing protein